MVCDERRRGRILNATNRCVPLMPSERRIRGKKLAGILKASHLIALIHGEQTQSIEAKNQIDDIGPQAGTTVRIR